jgi:hypothetical protein
LQEYNGHDGHAQRNRYSLTIPNTFSTTSSTLGLLK